MIDPPCAAHQAVNRAKFMLSKGGQYILGTGDYVPGFSDLPWTTNGAGETGSDCAGFAICWCWKLKRHRPGFNKGSWATVEDDINVNSIMEDAEHKRELALEVVVNNPEPGDLLCYPTFYIKGVKKPFIGHVALIEAVPFNYQQGRYDTLSVIQCHGPNHFKPGVVRTDGSLFLHHDAIWPKPAHRTKIIRMRERQ